jgi:hypothetical protein
MFINVLKFLRKYGLHFFYFLQKFISFFLNRFYFCLVFYLAFLLGTKFILQDVQNRINRLQNQKKIILIDISLKEVDIAKNLVRNINLKKGVPISPDQIKIVKPEKQVETFWQKNWKKLKSFFIKSAD